MRIIIAVVVMAMLAGCMAPTMNEAREEGPYKVLTSKKTDAALAKCVHYEWQNQPIFGGTPGATLQPGRDTGYTVFTEGSQYFVDIQPQGTGSVAKYYAVVGNWIANKRLTVLQSCL
ncbi:Pyruvate:ferredoxin oxidoreductase [Pseudomonas synxantha]|nr:Pyruvate:ferredoxin oxidoreductase [Pseudomonas synxantha]